MPPQKPNTPDARLPPVKAARLRGELRHWSLAAGIALLAGCAAGAGTRAPETVLHQYARALSEEHIEEAHSLLSADSRARLPLPEFRRMLRDNPQEVRDIAAHLLQSEHANAVTASVEGPDGGRIELVYEQDGWKIAPSALDLYAQHTPRAAIASFVRAFENKRYDVLMQFVPEAERHELTAETLQLAWEGDQALQMQRLTQSLKASLPALKVEVIGLRATVGYGAGGTVELVDEDGAWKIEDF